jgi:hypothetical protein
MFSYTHVSFVFHLNIWNRYSYYGRCVKCRPNDKSFPYFTVSLVLVGVIAVAAALTFSWTASPSDLVKLKIGKV